MAALSQYEEAATAFLEVYPVGTIVPPDHLVTWATDHANGLASDLLIGEPNKMISSLRRHLNNGGASRNLAEDKRFYLAIEDPKRKTMLVQSLADRTKEQAATAFDRSARGAIAPRKQAIKAIEDLKLEELDPEERQDFEAQLQEHIEGLEPLKNLLSAQNIDRYTKKLEAKGFTPEQARNILDLAPMQMQYHKTQRLLS